jgi:hypothetical protein
VGALGRWLEEEGIATTQISLVREHTEAIRPPRALWVPFIMGRPLGVPDDAAFQRRVLMAVLRLLEANSGPVLEDYPEDAPKISTEETEGFACPVSFGVPSTTEGLAGALQKEVSELAPWYELAKSRSGRTTAALSGLSAAAAAKFLTDFIANSATPSYRGDLTVTQALRLVTQDLKAYYLEAVAVQPGARAALAAREWFWHGTAAGKAFLQLRETCLTSEDESVRRFGARSLVPLAIAPRPPEAH